jgi:hypothetical protein
VIIAQTYYEPVEPIPPQPVTIMPMMSPPAEFEIINPPDNYVGPITNVPVTSVPVQQTLQQPMMPNDGVQETNPDDFYNWVVHPDNIKAENVLFKRP